MRCNAEREMTACDKEGHFQFLSCKNIADLRLLQALPLVSQCSSWTVSASQL